MSSDNQGTTVNVILEGLKSGQMIPDICSKAMN